MTRLAAAALLALAAFAPAPFMDRAEAREVEPCALGQDSAHCVVVLIDHLRRLSFRDDVRTVLVGNPSIADVTMISATEAVISAKSVGSTNMVFLNSQGLAISDFEVLVREPESQRVVLRKGAVYAELYQCAPRCERTLTQNDSSDPHSALAQNINREFGLSAGAAAAGPAAPTSAAPTNQTGAGGTAQ